MYQNTVNCKKPIGLKWVYKIKEEGRYRARLVVLGYNQDIYENYEKTFSPLLNYVIFRIILTTSHATNVIRKATRKSTVGLKSPAPNANNWVIQQRNVTYSTNKETTNPTILTLQ